MSHTFESNSGTKFHFNADLSGDITIDPSDDLQRDIDISASDLFEFLISRIANREFDSAGLSKTMQDFDLLKIEIQDHDVLITRIAR